MANTGNEESVLKHVGEIPCYRTSLLYGIGSGIASGLAYFLFTSRTRTATMFGLGTYVGVTLIVWSQCRSKLAEVQRQERLFRKGVQQKILSEGTVEPAKPLDLKPSDMDNV